MPKRRARAARARNSPPRFGSGRIARPSGRAEATSFVLLLLGTFCAHPAGAQDLLRARGGGATLRASPAAVSVETELLLADPAYLVLRLPGGRSVTNTRVTSERRPAGIFWRGRIDGAPVRHAVSLPLEGGYLVGQVTTAREQYTIAPAPGGDHTIALRTATAGDGRCAGTVSLPGARERAARAAAAPASAGRLTRATAVLDVLVVYSEAYASGVGGDGVARANIQGAVDYLTTAFANSRVDARARLVHSVQLPPLSATVGLSPQLTALRLDPTVAGLRATYRADLVAAVVHGSLTNRGECGVAYILGRGESAADMSPYAFSTVSGRCNLSEVLAHEIGHNLGLNHEPGNSVLDPAEAFAVYAYAFFEPGHFGTIMSYQQTVAPLYSNVDTTYEGVVPGVLDRQENGRALRDSAGMGANYSNFVSGGGGGGGGGAKPAAPSGLQAALATATRVSLQWTDNASNETSYHVEVKLGGGAFGEAAQTAADTTSIDLTLAAGATYSFRVRARNAAGYSSYSNQATLALPASNAVVPADLSARALSATEIELRWTGVSAAAQVNVEMTARESDYTTVGASPGDIGTLVVLGLDPEAPYTFRASSSDGGGFSDYSHEPSATTGGASGPCRADARHLCLLANRFEVAVAWKNPHPPYTTGLGTAVPVGGADKTGQFWFFKPANIELVLKMLDGRPLNGAFWHYYGALSDVEYWISIRDTVTGTLQTYHNPPFEQCGASDTEAFLEPAPAAAAALPALRRVPLPAASAAAAPRAAGTTRAGCLPTDTALCLRENRFRVEVTWRNQHSGNATGVGHVVSPLTTTDTGFFWFFNDANQELAVKILDGRAINGEFWFYWGALSDVEYTITVTDTSTGAQTTYHNAPGNICGGSDIDVF